MNVFMNAKVQTYSHVINDFHLASQLITMAIGFFTLR